MPLLISALLFATFASATDAPVAKAPADIVLPKARFTEGLRSSMPGAFCAPSTYFRQCFSGDEASCRKQVGDSLGACLSEHEKDFPAQFKQPGDGQVWGEKVGRCVGLRFETARAATKRDTADCRDEAKWK